VPPSDLFPSPLTLLTLLSNSTRAEFTTSLPALLLNLITVSWSSVTASVAPLLTGWSRTLGVPAGVSLVTSGCPETETTTAVSLLLLLTHSPSNPPPLPPALELPTLEPLTLEPLLLAPALLPHLVPLPLLAPVLLPLLDLALLPLLALVLVLALAILLLEVLLLALVLAPDLVILLLEDLLLVLALALVIPALARPPKFLSKSKKRNPFFFIV